MSATPSLEDLIAGASAPAKAEPTTTESAKPDKPAEDKPSKETETPPAEEAATDEGSTDGEKPETTETPETAEATDEDKDFLEYVRSEFGEDLSGKYRDSSEAVKGLVEAYRAVGRRDDDASYGRALRQMLAGREESLAEFLRGEQRPEPPKPSKNGKKEVEDFPDDADQWRFQLVEQKDGQYAPAPGSNFTMAEYHAYNAALARRLAEIARDYPRIKDIPKKVEEEFGKVQARTAEAKERQTIQELQSRYASVLFVNGDESGQLSPAGQQVDAEFRELYESIPGITGSKALQLALKMVVGKEQRASPKAQPKVSPRGVKTAGAAPPSHGTYKSVEDEIAKRIEKGEDMAKVLTEVHGRMHATKLG